MHRRVAENSNNKIRDNNVIRNYEITKSSNRSETEIIEKKLKLNPPEQPVKTKS